MTLGCVAKRAPGSSGVRREKRASARGPCLQLSGSLQAVPQDLDAAQGREVGVPPEMLVATAEQVSRDRSLASQRDWPGAAGLRLEEQPGSDGGRYCSVTNGAVSRDGRWGCCCSSEAGVWRDTPFRCRSLRRGAGDRGVPHSHRCGSELRVRGAGLRSEAEAGERALVVRVDDDPRHLAAADGKGSLPASASARAPVRLSSRAG
jgi:hypothetical protein